MSESNGLQDLIRSGANTPGQDRQQQAQIKEQQLLVPDFAQEMETRQQIPNPWQTQKPRHWKDQEDFPEDSFGLPEDWDYKSATNGPHDQELPVGAVGWTPFGEAYYGGKSELGEWAKGLVSRFLRPVSQEEGDEFFAEARRLSELSSEQFSEGKVFQALGSTLGWMTNQFKGVGAGGVGDSDDNTLITYPSRMIGEGFGLLFATAQDLAEGTEKTIGALEAINEIADGSFQDGSFADKEEARAVKVETGEDNWFMSWLNIVGTSGNTLLSVGIADLVKAATAPGTYEEKMDHIEASKEAGRVFYSSVIDPMVRINFMTRWKQGENPYLLAQELGNPLAELGGELIFDPLNLVSFWAKAAKRASDIAKGTRIIGTVGDVRIATAIDNLGDMNHLMEAERSGEVVTAIHRYMQEGVELLKDTSRSNVLWVSKNNRKKYGALAGLDASSRRYQLGRSAGDMAMITWKNAEGNIDTVTEVYRAQIMLASGKMEDVAEATAILGRMNLSINPYLSPVGREAAITMRAIATGTDGTINATRFLKKIEDAEDIGDIIKIFDPALESAGKKLFPTMAELGKMDDVVLTPTEKYIRGIESLKASGPVLAINKFFAHMYMGMSPGYVFRNVITNSLHLLADEGMGVLKNKAQFWKRVTVQDYIKDFYGAMPNAAKSGIGAAEIAGDAETFLGKLTGAGLKAGQYFEVRSSERLFATITKRVMRDMLVEGRAIPDMTQLIDKGMDVQDVRYLEQLIMNHNGNIPRAMKAFRADIKGNVLNLYKNAGWLGDDAKMLDDFNLLDHFKSNILKGDNIDDDLKALKTLRQEMKEVALATADEPQAYRAGIHQPNMEDMALSRSIGDDAKALFNNSSVANRQIEGQIDDFTSGLRKLMEDRGFNPADYPEHAGILERKFHETQSMMNERFRSSTWGWDKIIDRADETEDFGKIWKQIGLPGEPPAGLTKKQIGNMLWDGHYYPNRTEFWKNTRNNYVEQLDKLIYDVTFDGLALSVSDVRGLDGIKYALADAVKQDIAIVENGSQVWFGGAKLQEEYKNIWQLGYRNYVRTGKDGVLSADHLLNAINANLPEGVARFEKLTEVPFDVANKAFEARAANPASSAFGQPFNGIDEIAEYHKVDDVVDAGQVAEDVGDAGKVVTQKLPADRAFFQGAEVESPAGIGTITDNALKGSKGSKTRKYRVEVDGKGSWYEEKDLKALSEPQFFSSYDDLPDDLRSANETVDRYKDTLEKVKGTSREQQVQSDLKGASIRASQIRKDLGLTPDDIKILRGDEVIDVQQATVQTEKLGTFWGDSEPNMQRIVKESGPALDDMFTRLEKGIVDNYGTTKPITGNKNLDQELDSWEIIANQRTQEMRFIANETATAGRNFGLIDYRNRSNFGNSLGVIFPYHHFHLNTAKNWIGQRLAPNAGLVSGYAKYKDTLSEIHAGTPDWWKNNVNSDELLGLFPENPVFFNLEATLNPLNGLMGVDFNDPARRVDWWTRLMDDLGKLGPSVWTPVAMVTAYMLAQRGEEEAAAHWAGRLVPQSQTLESLKALSENGFNFGEIGNESVERILDAIPWLDVEDGELTAGGRNILAPLIPEFATNDIMVNLFSGGTDVWTGRRALRALTAMQDDGTITPEQAIDASWTQEGEVWDAAVERAVTSRAPGQITSFFMGVGFKGRSMQDQQVDSFYEDYYRLWNTRDSLTGEEFRVQMSQLGENYPFMDVVLIGRKGNAGRDIALAYNVLSRIPPGNSSLIELSGLDMRLVNKFYEDKGQIQDWTESDRNRFLASIMDMNAVLAIPEDATMIEWDQARNEQSLLNQRITELFGEDIDKKIDGYWALWDESPEARENTDRYLEQYPEVEAAMEYREMVMANVPESALGTYYSSVEKIERYYKGVMYDQAEIKFGADIFNIQSAYFNLASSEKRSYRSRNPQLVKYWGWRDDEMQKINATVIDLGSRLGEGQGATFRDDLNAQSLGEVDFYMGLQAEGEDRLTAREWSNLVGAQATDIIFDFVVNGTQITEEEIDFLEEKASAIGMDSVNALIQAIGISIAKSD